MGKNTNPRGTGKVCTWAGRGNPDLRRGAAGEIPRQQPIQLSRGGRGGVRATPDPHCSVPRRALEPAPRLPACAHPAASSRRRHGLRSHPASREGEISRPGGCGPPLPAELSLPPGGDRASGACAQPGCPARAPPPRRERAGALHQDRFAQGEGGSGREGKLASSPPPPLVSAAPSPCRVWAGPRERGCGQSSAGASLSRVGLLFPEMRPAGASSVPAARTRLLVLPL